MKAINTRSNFLRFYVEARSNPELNPKEDVYDAVIQAYTKLDAKSMHDVGLSMTHVDKLGINPRSSYQTPVGIYAYPFKWTYDAAKPVKSFKAVLPFESKAPYINLFSWKKSANILDLVSMDKTQFEYYSKKLVEVLGRLDPDTRSPSTVVERWVKESIGAARVKTYGGRFWYLTYKAKSHMAEGREYEYGADYGEDLGFEPEESAESASHIAMLWNSVFSQHKSKGFLDYGNRKTSEDFKHLSANQMRQLTKKLEKLAGKGEDETKWTGKDTAKGEPVLWNKIFRELGIDGVIDEGDGVVHNNEPYQVVLFNPRAVEKVARVDNVSRRPAEHFSKRGQEYMERIITLLRQGKLTKDAAAKLIKATKFSNVEAVLDMSEDNLLSNPEHIINAALFSALGRSGAEAYQKVRSTAPVMTVIDGYRKNFGDINSTIARKVLTKYANIYTYPLIEYLDLSAENNRRLVKDFIGALDLTNMSTPKEDKLRIINDILSYRNVQSVGADRDPQIQASIESIKNDKD